MNMEWSMALTWCGAIAIGAMLGLVVYDIFEKENEQDEQEDELDY